MYKCKVDGKTTYSQTECTGDIAIFKSFDSDKFHQDAIQKRKLEEAISIATAPRRELDLRYEEERDNILMKIKGLNLKLNQSFEQLSKNKKRKRKLEKDLKSLKKEYLNMIDSAGADQREIMNEIGELKATIKKIKKKQSNSTTTSYDVKTGRTKNCRTTNDYTYCY